MDPFSPPAELQWQLHSTMIADLQWPILYMDLHEIEIGAGIHRIRYAYIESPTGAYVVRSAGKALFRIHVMDAVLSSSPVATNSDIPDWD